MALSNLLVTMFSADELRRLVRYLPEGDRLVASLPGANVSAAAFADATVEMMQQHGRVDELVAAARKERPRRADEFSSVQVAPSRGSSAAPAIAPPPRAPKLPRGCRTFVSYAHQDRPLIERLEVSLALLKRQGYLDTWIDYRMAAGTVWSAELDQELASAQLVLLGISGDFNASDFCWGKELAHTLARQAAGEAVRVVPIFLRPADMAEAPYLRFQGLPAGGRTVTEHENADVAWKAIAEGLRSLF